MKESGVWSGQRKLERLSSILRKEPLKVTLTMLSLVQVNFHEE